MMIALLLTQYVRYTSSLSNVRHFSSTKAWGPIKFFYNDVYEVQLPVKHRFPMDKYRMVREALQREFAHQPELVQFEVSPCVTMEELEHAHCPQYIRRYVNGEMTEQEVRRTGFPWSKEHVARSLSSVGGTVAATRYLLSPPVSPSSTPPPLLSGHLAGGTHHAFFDRGEGFCIFSDIAVAALVALREYGESVQRVLIVDLDVHQGNGNAALFAGNDQVFTFSMQCEGNYFSPKQPSSLDLDLPPACADAPYLSLLGAHLPRLLDALAPSLVFFQAGVDVHERDALGKLSLSSEGVRERNRLVYRELLRRGVRGVVCMGGGYPRSLDPQSLEFGQLVALHGEVYRGAVEEWERYANGEEI